MPFRACLVFPQEAEKGTFGLQQTKFQIEHNIQMPKDTDISNN